MRPTWPFERPSPTIVGTRRSSIGMLVGRQLDDGSRQDIGGRDGQVGLGSSQLAGVRITAHEGALLQSYPPLVQKAESMTKLIALDLFAGTGWGVACQWLGIEENGVEIMPEAIATREANGMRTIYNDVWDGLEGTKLAPDVMDVIYSYNLLIASPPCQTFSIAGKGSGRKALDDVLMALKRGDYKDPAKLRELGVAVGDERTALVLTPLTHVYRDKPEYVVFEQVPQVLPVWEACAEEMREMGYSVWTGVLNCEQYGVPQTRKRAILIARADDKEAAPPTPTHSKYYPTDPTRLDPGVEKWITMAEALGWGTTDRPSYTVTGGGRETGGYEAFPTGARQGMDRAQEAGAFISLAQRELDKPSAQVEVKASQQKITVAEAAELQSYPRSEEEQWRWKDTPSTTIAGDPRITAREHHYHGEQNSTSFKLRQDEAHDLQSFPANWKWVGKKGKIFQQIGNAVPPMLARAILSVFLD